MVPIIGIIPGQSTDQLGHGVVQRVTLPRNYVDAILAAGGLPILLPAQDNQADAILDLVDGLLLSGGADLDPVLYGDTDVHPRTYGVDALRDRFEIELTKGAIARDLPLLCICRGIQVLNVALGGTLYQDIADQVGHQILHRQGEAGIESAEPSHRVHLAADSHLASIYGRTSLDVNSFHHQVIRQVASPLVVAAQSEDGLAEAVEMPDRSFVCGVQWHPEMMFERHPEHAAPFAAFVEATKAAKRALVAP
jgi:putative glutamine amidotransferase